MIRGIITTNYVQRTSRNIRIDIHFSFPSWKRLAHLSNNSGQNATLLIENFKIVLQHTKMEGWGQQLSSRSPQVSLRIQNRRKHNLILKKGLKNQIGYFTDRSSLEVLVPTRDVIRNSLIDDLLAAQYGLEKNI